MPGRAKSSCCGHSGPSPGIRSPWCSIAAAGCAGRRLVAAAAPAVPPTDPVGQLATRRITDAAAAKRPGALVARAESCQPGDTDLAWSGVTGWRALLAAALDQPPFDRVTAARVTGASDSPSADLLAAWLALTLQVPVTRAKATGVDGVVNVRLDRRSGPLELDRPGDDNATLSVPGRLNAG